jgi:multiple sugar transport system permease protein
MHVKKGMRLKQHTDTATSALAAGIPLIGFVIFGLIPLVISAVVSFTELHSTDLTQAQFVGLDNYEQILTNADNRTYGAYMSTIVFVLNVPITLAISLFIAYLLNRVKVFKQAFRAVFFIPYVCSIYAVGLAFKLFYNNDFGLLNSLLSFLGLERIGWLTDSPMSFMWSIIIMSTWMGLGYCIIMFQAALANVDDGYYEAAKMDGASSFQMFWKITWPAISPTTAYLLVIRLIGSMQAMAESMVFAGVGTPNWEGSEGWVSDFVVKHIYNMIFEQSYRFGHGMASAAGWILAILIFIMTQICLKTQRRWVNYDF